MLAEAEGDLAGALALVMEAQQVYLGDFSPNVRPLHAVAARLQIRLGDLDAAERWAHDHDVTASQELSYLREFEHVTLAEAMLARARHHADPAALVDADRLLQRLLDAATAGGRDATVIEVLVLQALAAHAGDDVEHGADAPRPGGATGRAGRAGARVRPPRRARRPADGGPRREPGRLGPRASPGDACRVPAAGATVTARRTRRARRVRAASSRR